MIDKSDSLVKDRKQRVNRLLVRHARRKRVLEDWNEAGKEVL